VVYVICSNSSYRVLKVNMNHYHRLNNMPPPNSYFAMDFPTPIDFAAQAKAYGMSGVRVTDPAQIRPELHKAFESGAPAVLDVVIDGAL